MSSLPPEPDLTPPEVRAAVERILGSRTFISSRQLQAFLRFVVEQTLAGDQARLKEYTIGNEVLGRGPGFDPKSDGVVRVQAGLLRKKLLAYYAEEGRDEAVIIDMPKGAYIPVWGRAVKGSSTAAKADDGPRRPPVKTLLLAVAAFDAILLIAAIGYFSLRKQTTGGGALATPAEAVSPLWSGFLSDEAPTVLAFGTPQFFERDGLLVRDTHVNHENDFSPRLGVIENALGGKLKPSETYTGIGEAAGAVLLSQFFSRHGRELRVLRNRHVDWNDVKDANLVFLSSMRFRTLADDLGLPGDFVFSSEGLGSVVNRKPARGEPGRFEAGANEDLAVITVAPGKTPGRRVMILSGSNTWGTQGAAEFVSRPEHLRDLARHLEKCRSEKRVAVHSLVFQAVIKIEIADRQPLRLTWLTHHDL